jgi:hypothetical protein
MKLHPLIIFLLCFTCFQIGKLAARKHSTETVRTAFVKGCEKGGNSPALTPWPLCPRAADNYIEGSVDTRGNE